MPTLGPHRLLWKRPCVCKWKENPSCARLLSHSPQQPYCSLSQQRPKPGSPRGATQLLSMVQMSLARSGQGRKLLHLLATSWEITSSQNTQSSRTCVLCGLHYQGSAVSLVCPVPWWHLRPRGTIRGREHLTYWKPLRDTSMMAGGQEAASLALVGVAKSASSSGHL